MNRDSSIGIFDSGIGGLTILQKIRELLPRENIIYYGDWKNNPYSEKSRKDIQEFSINIMEFLLKNNCKGVVIACSIFSAASLEFLKERYNVPIVGMIDGGVNAAILESENKKIAVMGSDFTINSNIYKENIKKICPEAEVYQIPCKALCTMLEKGWENYENRLEILEGYLGEIPKEADTLILGGTHYPFIIDDIKKFFNKKIVDSSVESVIELFRILGQKDMLKEGNKKGRIEFYINGDRDEFKKVARRLFEEKDLRNMFLIY